MADMRYAHKFKLLLADFNAATKTFFTLLPGAVLNNADSMHNANILFWYKKSASQINYF